jgi:hypothetical protein
MISCRVEDGTGAALRAGADEQSPRAAIAARREFIRRMVPWTPRAENRKNSRFNEEGSDCRIAKSREREAAK